MDQSLADFAARSFVAWFFRVKSTERIMFTGALGALVTLFGGKLLVVLFLEYTNKVIPDKYLPVLDTTETVLICIAIVCMVTILVAVGMAVAKFKTERINDSRKKVLVIEARGLRDDDGSPLTLAVPKSIAGQRISTLIDLRDKQYGKAINPEFAIKEIEATHRSIKQTKGSVDRSDLAIVYGGLTSVPYTFLTGILLDDESSIITFDWDRQKESWRLLDENDDGKEFVVSGLDLAEGVSEIVLAVSYSYPINEADLESTFCSPFVRLTLDGASSDAHWSEEKQNRLAQQFLEVIKKLAGSGVKFINLVLAAPNSVVFTFGRRYDNRNLPNIAVYQYERSQNPAYPWGVQMPVAGTIDTSVVYCRKNEAQ